MCPSTVSYLQLSIIAVDLVPVNCVIIAIAIGNASVLGIPWRYCCHCH